MNAQSNYFLLKLQLRRPAVNIMPVAHDHVNMLYLPQLGSRQASQKRSKMQSTLAIVKVRGPEINSLSPSVSPMYPPVPLTSQRFSWLNSQNRAALISADNVSGYLLRVHPRHQAPYNQVESALFSLLGPTEEEFCIVRHFPPATCIKVERKDSASAGHQ